MNVFKRGMLSVYRKRGKSIILFSLVFIIGILISGAISIQQAIQNTEERLMEQLPALATLDWDHEASTAAYFSDEVIDWDALEHGSLDLLRQIAALPQVKFMDLSHQMDLVSRELEMVPLPGGLPDAVRPEGWENALNSMRSRGGDFEWMNVTGVMSEEMASLDQGQFALAEGRLMTRDELDQGLPVLLLTRDLADHHQLQVGDVLEFSTEHFDWRASQAEYGSGFNPQTFYKHYQEHFLVARKTTAFEIVGILDVIQDFDYDNSDNPGQMAFQEHALRNSIFIPLELVIDHSVFLSEVLYEDGQWDRVWGRDQFHLFPVFVLYDVRDLPAFLAEAEALLPNRFLRMMDLSTIFGELTAAMDQLGWVSDYILWGSLAAGLVILSLVILLWQKDRKSEIGILLALGEKKKTIVSQILIETLVIALGATLLAVAAGFGISSSLSTQMIRQELLSEERRPITMDQWGFLSTPFDPEMSGNLSRFSPGYLSPQEMADAFDSSLNTSQVLLLLSVSFGVTTLSTVLPAVYATRLNPKKILM